MGLFDKTYLKLFISETIEPFETKLGWNVLLTVLCKMSVFCADQKSKKSVTARFSLK
jgi:hypothetical protein